MLRYTLKRLGLMLLTLWVIITATFFLMHLLPGDPLNSEKVPPEVRAQILHQYGLDQPIYVQYVKFLGNVLQGDLGRSMKYDGRPVMDLLLDGFSVSVQIGLQGLIWGTVMGLILGIIAVLRRGTWVDNLSTVIAVLGVSIPSFIIAPLLSYWVGVKWELLPVGLWEDPGSSILPSLVLSFFVVSQISRYVRTEMIEVLDQDYIKTAKAKGLSKKIVLIRHALRNALIPAVTILGPLSINIITGSLVVETIFALPGMGKYFVEAIQVKDLTLIIGTTIFYSFLIIVMMFIVDVLYGFIDPRIRLAQEGGDSK